MTFAYSRSWLVRTDAIPLTPNLPLDERWHTGKAVSAYFDNLLPEVGVRDFVARALHVSPGNVFALLERFGGDTAGALSLLPQGQLPSSKPRYLPMTHEAIRQCFASSRGIPLNLAGGEARIAQPGAQDKMAVLIAPTGAIAIPLEDAPSSHIVKPSIDRRVHLPQTAINEALVMRLAAAIGLDVTPVRYAPDLDAVVIARYDRQWVDGDLQRLHQNDLCQTLGIEPGRKYATSRWSTLRHRRRQWLLRLHCNCRQAPLDYPHPQSNPHHHCGYPAYRHCPISHPTTCQTCRTLQQYAPQSELDASAHPASQSFPEFAQAGTGCPK